MTFLVCFLENLHVHEIGFFLKKDIFAFAKI